MSSVKPVFFLFLPAFFQALFKVWTNSAEIMGKIPMIPENREKMRKKMKKVLQGVVNYGIITRKMKGVLTGLPAGFHDIK